MVYSESTFERNYEDLFSVCDKPNIYAVPRLEKFAFIVNINKIVEANSKFSLQICSIVNKVSSSSKGIVIMIYMIGINKLRFNI